ncbi:MAG: GNAT family N-acetyltransferase [Ferruginibacter sp.]
MVNIRKATTEDAKLITGLAVKTFIESHGHSAPVGDIENYISEKYVVDVIESELNDPSNIFHIIYFNGQAAGYSKIIFNCAYPLIISTNVTKLERLYLLKDFYDHKLGAKLFEFNTNLSKQEKQNGIWLYVWKENQRAISFYKKAGFEIIASADFKISETHSNPNYIMLLKYKM